MANKGPEFKEKMAEINRKKAQDPDWLAKNASANKKRQSKPCITPFGIFPSGRQAGVEYDKIHNTTTGYNRMSHYLKTGKEGYRFITLEEYIMLTGKDVL